MESFLPALYKKRFHGMCVQLILENLSDHNYIELPRATNCGNQSKGKRAYFQTCWRRYFSSMEGTLYSLDIGHYSSWHQIYPSENFALFITASGICIPGKDFCRCLKTKNNIGQLHWDWECLLHNDLFVDESRMKNE